jgi:hypothetical protein
MERLSVPWVFVGPSGSGKACLARKWIEEAYGVKIVYPMEVHTFTVGDGYEARVLTSPYHFEIDIPNLSMQDKQIIGDLLTMFLSSGDVLNSLRSSTRKLVILRRAHCLSLPAAIRVRAILQQYVLPACASGMIWMTTREITGPLALLDDAFVRYRVPRITLADWTAQPKVPEKYRTEEAWNKLEGRIERATTISNFFPDPTIQTFQWPRRIQDYYDEMVMQMLRGSQRKCEPNINVVEWLRGRVYEALSFCQTGPEIIDQCASAIMRNYNKMEPDTFWNVMKVLSESEPHTSYRTPLSLEWAFFNMFEEMRKTNKNRSRDERTMECNETKSSTVTAAAGPGGEAAPAPKTTVAKTAPRKRTAATKKSNI